MFQWQLSLIFNAFEDEIVRSMVWRLCVFALYDTNCIGILGRQFPKFLKAFLISVRSKTQYFQGMPSAQYVRKSAGFHSGQSGVMPKNTIYLGRHSESVSFKSGGVLDTEFPRGNIRIRTLIGDGSEAGDNDL